MPEKCVVDPERDCIGKAAAALLEKRIEDLEAWQRDSKKFHRDFYDWQRTQIARDARLDEQLNNIRQHQQNPCQAGSLRHEAGQTLGRHCGQGDLDGAGGGDRLCAGQSWAVKEGWICLIAKS